MKELEDAIAYNREVLIRRPLGHPNRSISLNNLANALHTRYKQLGRMEDLEEAITFHREALTLRPLGDSNRSRSLNNLSNVVLTRYEQLGRIEDLEDAIAYDREALTLRPLCHPGRSRSLNNLSNAIHIRYEQLGRMEDLEDAIAYDREALTFRPPGHPNRSSSLTNLANALYTRYEQLNRIDDLEKAITYNREALALLPLGHSNRSSSFNSLANSLYTRFKQLDRMEDLEEAIKSHHEALTLLPLGHPNRCISLNNLANVILTRYVRLGRMEDLDVAITFHHEALTLRRSGHSNRFSSLNNLANAVLTRYEHLGMTEDLEKAIAYNREAFSLLPLGHPDRSRSLSNLANAVLISYGKSHKIEDLEESFILYELAVNDSAASSRDRLAAAIRWAGVAQHHRHSSTIRAYSMSFRLLDHCLISYPSVDLQQKFLATANIPKSLASDAAAAAITEKNLEAAVELLEQGRTVLWSKMSAYRHPLDQLRQVDRQLADNFETLSGQLEHLALSSDPPMESPVSPAHLEVQMKRCRILSEQWEEVVGQIRKIQGFSDFLQAVPFATLRMAAAEGPVILVNISNRRSDAIILHIDNPPILVPLPDIQPKHLTLMSKQLASAQGPLKSASGLILPVLRDLWYKIVSPVHGCLTRLGVPEKSRIWWCPTSILCALPLHAAGPYLPRQNILPDIYTSSYIPTVSSLIRARSNMVDQFIFPKLLIIGQPETLPNVQDEIDHVRQLGDFVDVIVGVDANRDSVLRGLQQHSWAHFACHGRLGDNGEPFQGSFELHGGSHLTLLDLIQARLPNAELAFLTACHGVTGDPSTPDETIHLAAALQFCGFRSVVGALWAIDDQDGPIISKEFYKYMFREPGNKPNFRDSAQALNQAIRTMRKNRVPLERWITFVHTGA